VGALVYNDGKQSKCRHCPHGAQQRSNNNCQQVSTHRALALSRECEGAVQLGCDGTQAACARLFANLGGYRGMLFIPVAAMVTYLPRPYVRLR
jgi:hypothetical protein